MIRVVFFDLYGTLAGWQPAGATIQREAAAALGVTVDAKAIDRAYPTANAFMDSENARELLATRTQAERDSFFARYEQTLLAAAGSDVTLEVASDIWTHVRDTPKRMGPYDDAKLTLERLRRLDLALGVISNMGSDLERLLDGMGLLPLLDVIVSSGEAGVSKPHGAIFRLALAKAGVAPDEALHVGDGYDSDVVGSRKAGMHALLLLRDAAADAPDDCPVVGSLVDVPTYLEAHHRIS
jgi:putative hydrolase of the HAD superfamily